MKKMGYFTLCSMLFLLCLPILLQAQTPVAQWTFDTLKDSKGNFADVVLMGGATIANGQLNVDMGKWAVASPKTGGPDITEKTLVSWAYIDDLTILAGSIITLDQINADQFDGIVFGERQPRKWMAGSSGFSRTADADPGFEETQTGVLVCMAISYQDDGGTSHQRLYHNGTFIGDYKLGTVPTWKTGDAEVFWGIRHGNAASGGPSGLKGRIEESRIYNSVLSEAQIKALALTGTSAVAPNGKLATLWGTMKVK